ncbi:MAG: hypothetical protein P8J20_05260 [Novosphingobium sp.]|nr:hypothetical protein [Novosphingobium sp.]
MAASAFPREERIGLLAAFVAHGAMLALIVFRPDTGDIVRPPERIAVTLSDEVSLVSTSPDPFSDAAPDLAPTLGDAPAFEPDTAEVIPAREPPRAAPVPSRLAPRITPRRPPDARERRRPDRTARSAPPAARPARRPGGSRLGNNFLEGVSNSDRGRSNSAPAAAFGSREQASLENAISRQLRPHWIAPEGVDVELLVTTVRFRLAKDGSLTGEPRVLRQTGRTQANTNQLSRHAEQAVRAVKLAAPFNLPPQFYAQWRTVTLNFDRNLAR